MDSEERDLVIDFLTEVPFFSEVSKEALSHLFEQVEIEHFRAKENIFKKDERGEAMYVILDGKVKVHELDHLFGYLSKKDCFGEYALIDNQARSASVTAVEETRVLRIERTYFLDLMSKDKGFAQGLLSVMIKRHRELDVVQERLASSKNEIANANAKMSGLINGAMDAIIMFDEKFRIILTNPSAEELLENNDVIQRNVLFFFEDKPAALIESFVQSDNPSGSNDWLAGHVVVIGSNETRTITEGTISKYGEDEVFYTLILRNIEKRLEAEDTIDLLTSQTEFLKEEINELTSTYGILAEDASMLKVLESISQVAGTNATVLITGETGTGKELVARAIHMSSNRNDKPLIRVNCGAIPTNLIESELFGHEKGAFTGAIASRKGRFHLADKGTIFLDEIGELPLELQPKLLRVIQEGEFDPLGSSETMKVDVRIIAATHRDLLEYSREGKFREDLYYRLNVFPLEVPALRDRGGDVCSIASEMIDRFAKKLNKPMVSLSENDKQILLDYHWPGNVRELQNLVERAVIVSENGMIDWKAIIPSEADNEERSSQQVKEDKIYTAAEMVSLERSNILRALKQTGWKISGKNGAAALLQIAPTTLSSKIKAHGIERPV
jgi:formate hydrogenlyase transcriptional activator